MSEQRRTARTKTKGTPEMKTKKIHRTPHATIPVRVWVNVDTGIADDVRWLNALTGVRTFASCEGTIGEGGPAPFRPFIMAWWPQQWDGMIRQRFRVGERGAGWAYLHPKSDFVAKKLKGQSTHLPGARSERSLAGSRALEGK